MTQKDPDVLVRAIEQRREFELRQLARDQVKQDAQRRRRKARRRALNADRAALAALAQVADPILRSWVARRLELALRAYPGSRGRSIELPPLLVTCAGARFRDELGENGFARSEKRYVVAVGRQLTFRWSARAIGGAGGGRLPIRPHSFATLATIDLTGALGHAAEWQEADVLAVAIRVAEAVRDGDLEARIAEAMVNGTSR